MRYTTRGVRFRVQTLVIDLVIGMVAICSAAAAESPHNNYMIHCQGCHLPDGSGNPPDVPSFTGQLSDFLLVEGGRAYLVQVPGTANAPLDDASVAELLNWMLERFGDRMRQANFAPYSAQEVADYRRERLADPAGRRKALLATLSGA